METIPHRELRNRSSDILARVSAGESIAVTNNGRLAAIIGPPAATALEQARRAGAVREPSRTGTRFDRIVRARLPESTDTILSDLRGDR